jgi:hypothetical protein
MSKAVLVRLVQRIGDLDGDLQCLIHRHRSFFQPLGERLPFQKFHHQEVSSVFRPDIENRTYIWVTQAGQRSGFALETRFEFGILGDMAGKNFDGDETVQPCVSRFVDLSEPARPSSLYDFIGFRGNWNKTL